MSPTAETLMTQDIVFCLFVKSLVAITQELSVPSDCHTSIQWFFFSKSNNVSINEKMRITGITGITRIT